MKYLLAVLAGVVCVALAVVFDVGSSVYLLVVPLVIVAAAEVGERLDRRRADVG